MNEKIAFIGTGNMGGALIRGIINSKLISPQSIFAYDINQDLLGNICNKTGIKKCKSNINAVKSAKYIMLVVKPQYMKNVLDEIKGSINSDKVIISIAAGLGTEFYKKILGSTCRLIRVMPNTPALINEGTTVISFNDNFSDNEKSFVMDMFNCVGYTQVVDDAMINRIIAISASSPAYVYILIDAIADAAVKSGLPKDISIKLASNAVKGAASLVLKSGKHPIILKDEVCSPAGTTVEAVSMLEKHGFRNAVMEAVKEVSKKADIIESSYLENLENNNEEN